MLGVFYQHFSHTHMDWDKAMWFNVLIGWLHSKNWTSFANWIYHSIWVITVHFDSWYSYKTWIKYMPIVTKDTHTGITSMSTGYFLSKDSYTSDVLPAMLSVSSWWRLVSSLCVFRFSLCSWLFSKVIELCSANYKIKWLFLLTYV